MNVLVAARFSAVSSLLSLVVTIIFARPGLRIVGVLLPRQVWLVEESGLWLFSWWLWLLAIFSWMVVLVSFMWSYLPGHRASSMLQSGLMIIAAALAIAGISVWMNALPFAAGHEEANTLVPLVDEIALALLGSGFFMAGAVTGWMTADLLRLKILPAWLLVPGFVVGAAYLTTPFLLPQFTSLAAGGVLWIIWMLLFAVRRALPSAYTEWQ